MKTFPLWCQSDSFEGCWKMAEVTAKEEAKKLGYSKVIIQLTDSPALSLDLKRPENPSLYGINFAVRLGEAALLNDVKLSPIPMLIVCPRCGAQHVDKDEWATKPHRTHRCDACGREWRPSNLPTVGVDKLP